jgi:hypothetical protein
MADPRVCTKVIDAHTVQRSGALKQLVDAENKVRTFYPIRPDAHGLVTPRSVGWREASTFTGFCSVHDATFAPVETVPFTASAEQCFLLSYRAVCFELYQKRGAERAHHVVLPLVQRGRTMPAQREIHGMMSALQAGTISGRRDAEALKAEMDGQLLSGRFHDWTWEVFDFDGPLQITTCGGVSPTHDFAGHLLQELADLNRRAEWLTVNIVPRSSGGSIVLGYRSCDSAPRALVEDLKRLTSDRLVQVLPQFVFAHLENTYFSGEWWDNLTVHQKTVIARHAANPNAYDNRPVYAEIDLLAWRMSGHRTVLAA